jgi:hypothetical protein
LDIVLPEVGTTSPSTLGDTVKEEIEQAIAYQVMRDVNLADLLEPNFLNSFVRKGKSRYLTNRHRGTKLSVLIL